jgi:hypothetical protein
MPGQEQPTKTPSTTTWTCCERALEPPKLALLYPGVHFVKFLTRGGLASILLSKQLGAVVLSKND